MIFQHYYVDKFHVSTKRVLFLHLNAFTKTHSQNQHITRNEKLLHGEKKAVLLFVNNMHLIMYNTSRSYLNGLVIIQLFSFSKCLCAMFKILMLSKITIILTSFVNNIDNVRVNDLAYYFFFKKSKIYGLKIQ